jgi:hypothetical protein
MGRSSAVHLGNIRAAAIKKAPFGGLELSGSRGGIGGQRAAGEEGSGKQVRCLREGRVLDGATAFRNWQNSFAETWDGHGFRI